MYNCLVLLSFWSFLAVKVHDLQQIGKCYKIAKVLYQNVPKPSKMFPSTCWRIFQLGRDYGMFTYRVPTGRLAAPYTPIPPVQGPFPSLPAACHAPIVPAIPMVAKLGEPP